MSARLIAQQTLCYGVGIVVMKSISLLMLPLLTRFLTPDAYAQLDLMLNSANLLSLLIGMGLVDALYRFSTQYPTEDVFSHSLQLALLIGLMGLLSLTPLLLLIQSAYFQSLPQAGCLLLLATVLLEGAIALPLAWLRMQDQAVRFLQLTVLKTALQALLTLLLLQHGYGINGVLAAGFIAALLLCCCLLGPQRHLLQRPIHKGLSRQLLSYGSLLMCASLASFVQNGMERFFMAHHLSLQQLAEYALAAKFALIVSLLLQPYCMWWFAKRFAVLQQPDGLRLNAFYSVLGCQLITFAGLLVAAMTPMMIQWLTPSSYHASTLYCYGAIVAVALKHAGDLLNLGCYAQNHSRLPLRINLCSASVALLGYSILIPTLAVYGALIALCISYVTRLGLMYYYSQRLLTLPYPKQPLLHCASLLTVGLWGLSQSLHWLSISVLLLYLGQLYLHYKPHNGTWLHES